MGNTKEEVYVCSGGPMGGTKIAINDKCPFDTETQERSVELDHTDENGDTWKLQYNLREHDPNTREKALVYIGCKPATEK